MFGTRCAIVALTMALAACDGLPTEQRQLSTQQQAWASARPAAYTFRYRVSCFCRNGMVKYRVRVRDGRVVEAAQIEPLPSDAAFPAPIDGYLTVDSLFATLAEAYERKADRVDVTFDTRYHFPTRIQIDWLRDAIDDEVTIDADGFVVNDAR